jgi:hypothetical protein
LLLKCKDRLAYSLIARVVRLPFDDFLIFKTAKDRLLLRCLIIHYKKDKWILNPFKQGSTLYRILASNATIIIYTNSTASILSKKPSCNGAGFC